MFLLIIFLSFYRSSASCTVDTTPLNASQTTNSSISPSDEIINGINYGKIYSIPNGIWMFKPFNVLKSYTLITDACPTGWVPPTQDDLNNLLSFVGSNYSLLTDPSLFNMNNSLYYASNTKYAPTVFNGSNNDAWKFYTLQTDGTSASIQVMSSYWDNNILRVLCVHSAKSINNSLTSASSLNITGLSTKKDLLKGIKYSFSVNNTNMIAYQWNFSGLVDTSKDFNIIPMKYGQFLLNVKAALFDGTTIGYCLNLWVRNYTGSEANTTINTSDIHKVALNQSNKVYRSYSLHFTSGSAPIAPIDSGGAYIIYALQDSNNSLLVKTIDNDGNQANEIDIGKQGYPFDIVAIPCGFVSLIKDYNAPDTLTLFGWSTCDNKKLFERIIMNNGDQPITYNENQLVFFSTNSSGQIVPMTGLEAMFNPSSGRLAFGKGRIIVIFAHYNHFGNYTDGSRNDHTGDTIVTFDLNGQDEKIAISWGASHSLSESLVYNGQKGYSSALGDAYPQNIRFSSFDVLDSNSEVDPKTGLYNQLDLAANSSLLNDTIPGNGGGKSCGRMGVISVFGDGDYNVATYSRRKCSATYSGTTTSSTIDMMGVALYDNVLNRTGNINLGSGNNTNQIQSAKYGRNLFVAYVTSFRSDGTFLTNSIASTDKMSYLLLDLNGTIINGTFDMNSSFLPPSDDMRVLSDGRVAWTYVDENYTLNYYYLTKPEQTPTNEDLVKNSSFYKNDAVIYAIDPSDQNIYKDSISGISVKSNQTNSETNSNGTNGNGNFLRRIPFEIGVLITAFILVFQG